MQLEQLVIKIMVRVKGLKVERDCGYVITRSRLSQFNVDKY